MRIFLRTVPMHSLLIRATLADLMEDLPLTRHDLRQDLQILKGEWEILHKICEYGSDYETVNEDSSQLMLDSQFDGETDCLLLVPSSTACLELFWDTWVTQNSTRQTVLCGTGRTNPCQQRIVSEGSSLFYTPT